MTDDLFALLEHGAACVCLARKDKRPLGHAWNTLATSAADVIAGWLGDGYNLGILLGHGNLIDVEYDDEGGRQTLERLGLLGIPGAALSLGGVVALTALEFLVAFLQAFVFAVLTCVYLNDVVNLGHHH